MKVPPLPPIVIDTREQLPYEFTDLKTVRLALEEGDYSLVGSVRDCAVERKSREDAWGCVGGSRVRFRDCLSRLTKLKSPAIVIESNLDDFVKPPPRTRLSPAQVVGAYISWSEEFRIPIFFCPSRAYAERVTLRWLMAYWRHLHRGSGASGGGVASAGLMSR